MPRDVARASLYRGKINLWVEDEITRAYLAELWDDPDIVYLVGGGNEGVRAIVHDAEVAGYRNVFAVIDRDFGTSNVAHWLDHRKTARTFVLPAHEVENYLLDPEALAACTYNNRNQPREAIDALMLDHATRLCWWAACRAVVAELRRRFRLEFINDPRYPNVDREAAAIDHILTNTWYQRLSVEARRSEEPEIRRLVAEQYVIARDQVANGAWRTEFAGKEILHDIGSRIVDWTKLTRRPGSGFDSDLAKEVATWQKGHQSIPPTLTTLLQALKLRIAPARPSP